MAPTVCTLSQWVSTYLLGISLSVCIKSPPPLPTVLLPFPKTSKSLKSVLYHLATSVIKPSVGMSALKACQEHLFTNGPIITPDMYTQEELYQKTCENDTLEIICTILFLSIIHWWCLQVPAPFRAILLTIKLDCKWLTTLMRQKSELFL